jgi:hypothetical protein
MTPYQRYVHDIALTEIALKWGHRRVAALPRLQHVAWHAAVTATGRRDAVLAVASGLVRLAGGGVGVVRAPAPRHRAGGGTLPACHLWSRGGGPSMWTAWHLWITAALATRGSRPPRVMQTHNGVEWTAPVDLGSHPLGSMPSLEGVGARAHVSVGIAGVSMAYARMVCAACCLPL